MNSEEIIRVLGGNDNISKITKPKENDIICDFGIPEFGIGISIYHVDKTNGETLSLTVLLDEGQIAFDKTKNLVISDNTFYLIKDYSKIDRRPFKAGRW